MEDYINEGQKAKWLKVMGNVYMSSEESGGEDTIIVHPLPWRTEYVNQMFQRIDAYCSSRKSPQARRQTKKRSMGSSSTRPKPIYQWCVFDCYEVERNSYLWCSNRFQYSMKLDFSHTLNVDEMCTYVKDEI